jgi:hypothetical protein
MRERLTYYLGRKPSDDEVAEAEEWQEDHPESDLAEFVEAMIEIGAL